VLVVLVLVLLRQFVGSLYRVPSGSMEPTLTVGQRFVAERISPRIGAIDRQDVIVFQIDPRWRGAPDPTVTDPVSAGRWFLGELGIGGGLESPLVKRVIGLPGDTVECCDAAGAVLVNGVALEEPYLGEDFPYRVAELDCTTTPRSRRCFGPVTVPSDRLLVLGDHRSNSDDSVQRCRGVDETPECARFVRVDRVIGTLLFTLG